MFEDWRERRRLRREIAGIERRYRSRLHAAATDEDRELIEGERDSELVSPQMLLEIIELEQLTTKARGLGLDYSAKSGSHDTSDANAKLRKLIRDEQLNMAERWVKILVPILTVLVGPLGLLVALITVLKSK
jgi:hypothetical protein